MFHIDEQKNRRAVRVSADPLESTSRTFLRFLEASQMLKDVPQDDLRLGVSAITIDRFSVDQIYHEIRQGFRGRPAV